jgi:hypothetical protein
LPPSTFTTYLATLISSIPSENQGLETRLLPVMWLLAYLKDTELFTMQTLFLMCHPKYPFPTLTLLMRFGIKKTWKLLPNVELNSLDVQNQFYHHPGALLTTVLIST